MVPGLVEQGTTTTKGNTMKCEECGSTKNVGQIVNPNDGVVEAEICQACMDAIEQRNMDCARERFPELFEQPEPEQPDVWDWEDIFSK